MKNGNLAQDVERRPQCLSGWRKMSGIARGLTDCGLIVPTYRRPKEIVALLQVLVDLPDPPRELIVVDGSPTKDTEQALREWAKPQDLPFDLVYVKTPVGLTRQRNAGIEASTKEFIFFLDDDCLPEPGFFRTLRSVFDSDPRKEVGAVSGSFLNEIGQPLPLRWRLRFLLGLVPRGEPGKYYPTATSVPRSLLPAFTGTRSVDMVPGGATAFRRSVFDRHRFSHFFNGYSQGEDLEMSLRIGREWKLLWCGDAYVHHHHTPGGRPTSIHKGRMEVRNRFFIWKRYSPAARMIDKIRFWLDIAYVFFYDVASFVMRPTQFWYVSHAVGLAWGSVECWTYPPRYEEPAAAMEFKFTFETLGVEQDMSSRA
jgi:GT2 family glycosyltransferase